MYTCLLIRHSGQSGPSEVLAQELFATLRDEQVQKLAEFYKMDFLAFGYSWKEYQDIAGTKI